MDLLEVERLQTKHLNFRHILTVAVLQMCWIDAMCCAIVQGRELPADVVLGLLRGASAELCCQYLEYLVGSKGSQEPAHHTELALRLSDQALTLMLPVDHRFGHRRSPNT